MPASPLREFGRTLPAAAFAGGARAEGRGAPAAGTAEAGADAAHEAPDGGPALASTSLEGGGERRFAVGAMLGAGATSRVYELEDRDLERHVAVKLLAADGGSAAEDIARFVAEARITASLAHPNVLPVHDVGRDAQGRVFFTMARVDGRSLGALIESSTPAGRSGALGDVNALVSIAIGVCQALAFAHRRGIVHQDIKPDNIMLGEFGEVLVVDWGSARRGEIGEAHLYGTPLYMSPEQARRERADARSDVYCVGATLFHALTLRLPTWHDDAEAFWHAKRAGTIAAPTAAERAASPAALLAIALKALEPDPARRYADAAAMLEDLRRYQAGLAVSALPESPWQTFRRWHARHARSLWSWSAAAAVVLALAGMLWGKHLEEMARWGRPVAAETFDDDGWRGRWVAEDGAFERADGRLVSTGPNGSVVMLRRRLRGAVAIEFEGEMLADGRPCDISAVWARELRELPDGRCQLTDVYLGQVGAFDNSHCAISLRSDGSMHLAYAPLRAEPGRRYRVRFEVDGSRLSLLVDGERLCTWDDAITFSGGFLGVYAHYPRKAFDDVRIYQREVPAKVPAIAIGDAAARSGGFALAAEEYRQVAESHAGKLLGEEARFKQGLSLRELGRGGEADEAWSAVVAEPWASRIALRRAETAAEAGDDDGALATVVAIRRSRDEDLRAEAAAAFARMLRERYRQFRPHTERLGRYVAVYESDFADAGQLGSLAANAYLALDRYEDVLERFPTMRFQCAAAFNGLGRYDETIARFPDQTYHYFNAFYSSGRFDEMPLDAGPIRTQRLFEQARFEQLIAESAGTMPYRTSLALAHLGRFAEAEALMPADGGYERGVLLGLLGRPEAATADPDPRVRRQGLIALGRWRDLAGDDGTSGMTWARCLAGLDAWIAGDLDAARRRFPMVPVGPTSERRALLMQTVLLPWLEGLARAGWDGFDRAAAGLDRYRWLHFQLLWHDGRYLRGLIDDAAYLAQPRRAFVEARLLLVRAMRHERHGRRTEALADWRAWLALPVHRRNEENDALLATLAAWRVRELAD